MHEFLHAARGCKVFNRAQSVLQLHTSGDDFRRLFRARQRAGQDGIHRNFHLAQHMRELLGALNALGRQRALVFLVTGIAGLTGIAMAQEVKVSFGRGFGFCCKRRWLFRFKVL